MSKLVLLDGNAIMHRAYHAFPAMTTPAGAPINAVYGFVSMLIKIVDDLKPSHIIAAFDRKEPTFRKKLLPAYQSHRPEMEEELSSQIDKIQKTLKTFSIPVQTKAGYEADDIIGTIVKMAVKGKTNVKNVVIVTGDRDILQLVSDKVQVYLPVKGLSNAKLMKANDVKDYIGVKPSQIIDYKAFVGDSSDNYPGVKGIGPKTAIHLLNKYGSFEEIYKYINEIQGSAKDKLINQKKEAQLSKKLAKIVTDLKIEDKLVYANNWNLASTKTMNLFDEYGFRSLKKRVFDFEQEREMKKQGSLF